MRTIIAMKQISKAIKELDAIHATEGAVGSYGNIDKFFEARQTLVDILSSNGYQLEYNTYGVVKAAKKAKQAAIERVETFPFKSLTREALLYNKFYYFVVIDRCGSIWDYHDIYPDTTKQKGGIILKQHNCDSNMFKLSEGEDIDQKSNALAESLKKDILEMIKGINDDYWEF